MIDAASFRNISGYLDEAKGAGYELVAGGNCDDSVGYFVEPTLVRAEDPHARLMKEEIFGPVMTVYVYPDDEVEQTAGLV